MKDWLLDILRDPETGGRLVYDPSAGRLASPTEEFAVEEGVPSFVKAEPSGEGFDYAAHYTADAEQFDYFVEDFDPLTAVHLGMLRETVLRTVPRGAGLLLDVGCGSAFVAGRMCPQGARVVSLDIARANPRKALAKYPYENHAGVVADAYRLPFADGTFDCIVASEIIEHTVDPQGFLASLLSKLKPGGTLVVSTPYKEKIVYSLCIHCNRKTPLNAHLHSFDEGRMRRMASAVGAEVEGLRLVGNKLLLRTHLSRLAARMGYGVWRCCDGTANRVVRKAEHFVVAFRRR